MGLRLAWDTGFCQIILEVDNKVLADIINGTCESPIMSFTLVQEIRCLLNRPWDVRIQYVFRERNKYADILSKKGIYLNFDYFTFHQAPHEMLDQLRQDVLGVPTPRLCTV